MRQYPFKYVVEVQRNTGQWDALVGTDNSAEAIQRAQWMTDKLRAHRTHVRVILTASDEIVYEEHTHG